MPDKAALHLLIQQKLINGHLPQNSIPRLWGRPGSGEACLACDEAITSKQLMMEGISREARSGVIFHVQCYSMWDTLRKVAGHEPSSPR